MGIKMSEEAKRQIAIITKNFEAEAKNEIVKWLMKRTGQSELAVKNALKNPKYKNSWQGLYKAVKDKNCYRPTDYFGCACNGEPLKNCPQHGNYYDVIWETDKKTGALIGFALGGCICKKYASEKAKHLNDGNDNSAENNKKIAELF